jgi:hypothetical protein
VAITERRSKADIDRLAEALREAPAGEWLVSSGAEVADSADKAPMAEEVGS